MGHDRRERALAARHVDRGRGDRAGPLAHDHARRDLLAPVRVAQHALVVGPQCRDHAVERVAQLGRELRAGSVELGLGHAQVAGGRIDAVEALQRGAQRPVARGRDVLVDRAHRRPQLGVEDAVERAVREPIAFVRAELCEAPDGRLHARESMGPPQDGVVPGGVERRLDAIDLVRSSDRTAGRSAPTALATRQTHTPY